MTPQRWQRIGEIYHSALPLIQAERATFVTNACGGDPDLQEEVNSLLESDETSGDFLRTSVFEVGLKILASESLKSTETATLDHQATDKLLGTILDGRYLIEGQLGHGGVGAVYLAHDHKLHNKPVVVKVLLEESLKNEWVALKFQQEKEALARVDHPGVVGILDTGELPDGEPYIVMQYIEGISLRDAIKDTPEGMNLERVAFIIKQMGSALDAVHEKKIYHRDLKPENIMLQRLVRGEEQVKILDFGVAKVKESLIAPSTVTGAGTAGTILYMSPEQLRGEKVTAASDIYSFGAIAYEMVTGRRPFNPDTIAHLAEMQRQGVRAKPGDLRPRLSGEAERIILTALAFDPKARYQNAAEFGDSLARALMNEEEETLRDPRRAVVEMPPTQLSVESVLPGRATTPRLPDTIARPFEPAHVSTAEPMSHQNMAGLQRSKRRWPWIASALAIIAVLLLGGYLVIANRHSLFGNGRHVSNTGGGDSGSPVSQRSLAYWLTVQKIKGNRPDQEFVSSGQETFENGDKFRLNVSSPQSGYLYVFNEGADDFTIIYPTPKTNNGSAKLDGNQTVQTNWNTFVGNAAGTEDFWIIWSASPVNELEAARNAAFKSKDRPGALTDASMERLLRNFLAQHTDPKAETTNDTEKQQTVVRVNSDLLVKLVGLEHR